MRRSASVSLWLLLRSCFVVAPPPPAVGVPGPPATGELLPGDHDAGPELAACSAWRAVATAAATAALTVAGSSTSPSQRRLIRRATSKGARWRQPGVALPPLRQWRFPPPPGARVEPAPPAARQPLHYQTQTQVSQAEAGRKKPAGAGFCLRMYARAFRKAVDRSITRLFSKQRGVWKSHRKSVHGKVTGVCCTRVHAS